MADLRNKIREEMEKAQIEQWQAEERARREYENRPLRCRCGHL